MTGSKDEERRVSAKRKLLPTRNEIMLASAIVHLIEFIDTGEPMDLHAADSLIGALVPGLLQPLYEQAFVPLRRDRGAPFAIKVKP